MTGLKSEYLKLMNARNLIGDEFPEYIAYQQRKIYNILEDVYSVGSATELQEAIDTIGSGAGTIFIEAGTHIISSTINVNTGGTIVIYGHGGNTILLPNDGIDIFNITDGMVIIEKIKLDLSNYTANSKGIIINETNNKISAIDRITITGDGVNGYGIELSSNNCRIGDCTIDNVNIGINVLSDNNILNGNNCNNCASYGIQISADYNNITSNICNSNLTGIYVLNGTGNTINDNTVQTNTQNGIYLNGSSQNSLNDNICDGNDSNTGNPQGGIVIDAISNNNMIISNTSINNQNAGAGIGYGIYIAAVTCIENVVRSNNCSGNDVQWKDIGLNSDFEYRCSTAAEIQDAIDSIALKSEIIQIISNMNIDTTIDIDGGGDYIIKGGGIGTVLTTVGDIPCFNVTSAKSCILKDFKIDASSLTITTTEIIDINEGSDNRVIVENINIQGDGTNGHGITIHSNNCIIRNNDITDIYNGIGLDSSSNNVISNNFIDNCNYYGIRSQTSNNNKYDGNICKNNAINGMLIKGNNNSISGNKCNNNTSSGIYIYGSYNILIGNICNSNGTQGIENDQSSYGTIVGNTCNNNIGNGILIYNCTTIVVVGNECYNNCEGYAFNAAGIGLAPNADYCTVSGNICGNNTNTTGGVDGHGIRVQAATCDNNIISSNVLYGNDVDFLNNGTGTVIMQGGWTGWFDDGTNFRMTVRDGMIIAVDNSTAGGHNP